MKALLIAIACVAAVCGLAACGAADGEDGAAQARTTPTPAAAVVQARTTATAATTQAQTPTPAAVVAQAQTPMPAATAQAPTPAPAAVATAGPGGTPESLRAPEFSLPSADGGTVSLSGLLNEREGAALVFYRGFF